MREHLYRGFMADSPTQTLRGADRIIIDGKVIYGEWVYGYLANANTIDEYEQQEIDGVVYEIFKRHCAVLLETIGEYTGLTDRNGKKIFEGHICTDGENTYEVVFDKYQFAVKVIKTPLYLIQKGDIFPLWQFDDCERNGYRQLEIIGNIHDNPELLDRE